MDNRLTTPSGKWDNRIAFHIKDVCEMLGLAKSTISEYYKDGRLKVMKIGKHYLILRSSLEEFFADAEDEGMII